MLVIPSLGRLRQNDHEFEIFLGSIVTCCLRKRKKRKVRKGRVREGRRKEEQKWGERVESKTTYKETVLANMQKSDKTNSVSDPGNTGNTELGCR